MKDPFKTDKPLIDKSIEYDYTKLPKELIEHIKKLEEYDELGDWFNYDIVFDILEVDARDYLRRNIITSYDYKKITAKYGWLYD